MTEEEIKAECEKCIREPWYFYNTYWTIDGIKPTPISKEEWESIMHIFQFKRGGIRMNTCLLIKKANENKT